MTNAEELRKLYYAEPFKPFDILLDDGRTIRVKNRINFGFIEKTQYLMFGHGKIVDWAKFDRVKEIRTSVRSRRSAGGRPRTRRAREGRAK